VRYSYSINCWMHDVLFSFLICVYIANVYHDLIGTFSKVVVGMSTWMVYLSWSFSRMEAINKPRKDVTYAMKAWFTFFQLNRLVFHYGDKVVWYNCAIIWHSMFICDVQFFDIVFRIISTNESMIYVASK